MKCFKHGTEFATGGCPECKAEHLSARPQDTRCRGCRPLDTYLGFRRCSDCPYYYATQNEVHDHFGKPQEQKHGIGSVRNNSYEGCIRGRKLL